jgi:D-lactate dehydrogenase
MKISVFEIETWERAAFKSLEKDHDVEYSEQKLTLENASQYQDTEVISTFIYSGLNRALLKELPNLKMIATRATGTDNIDNAYCRERSIQVFNVPDYAKSTVAEHTFGLLLTLSHHLYESIDRTRKGDFTPDGLRGFDLKGKTLGVIGTGSIGRNVIRIGLGFGMKILAYDIHQHEELMHLPNFQYVSMDKLLMDSDVITLHVPSIPQTKNMLSEAAFQKMKTGVVILNTARGDLIDIDAFIKALATGKVSAAGLDVLAEEPVIREEAEILRSIYQKKNNLDQLLADQALLRMRNVVVTPHNAFNTREAIGRILTTTISSIEGFAADYSEKNSKSA